MLPLTDVVLSPWACVYTSDRNVATSSSIRSVTAREYVLFWGAVLCLLLQTWWVAELGLAAGQPGYYVIHQNITLETSRHRIPPTVHLRCLHCTVHQTTPSRCTVNTMSLTCHTSSSGHVFQLLPSPANQKPGNEAGDQALFVTCLVLQTRPRPQTPNLARMTVKNILSFAFFCRPGTIVGGWT